MKIVSYNVNGIRSAMSKGLTEWIKVSNADIVCFQEIKASPDQIDTAAFEALGYHHYWFPAQKKGYSGVALLTKNRPDFVESGMGIPEYDMEGRLLRSDFGNLTHLTVYFPSGTSGEERQEFKMKFLADFQRYIQKLRQTRPNIVVSCDLNIAHTEIDINHPKRHVNMSGFLPEERAWVDGFLKDGFIDSFRKFDTKPEQYSWWTYRANARQKNLGWRIDYHIVSNTLEEKLKSATICPEAIHSDHCPVTVELDL